MGRVASALPIPRVWMKPGQIDRLGDLAMMNLGRIKNPTDIRRRFILRCLKGIKAHIEVHFLQDTSGPWAPDVVDVVVWSDRHQAEVLQKAKIAVQILNDYPDMGRCGQRIYAL